MRHCRKGSKCIRNFKLTPSKVLKESKTIKMLQKETVPLSESVLDNQSNENSLSSQCYLGNKKDTILAFDDTGCETQLIGGTNMDLKIGLLSLVDLINVIDII